MSYRHKEGRLHFETYKCTNTITNYNLFFFLLLSLLLKQ